jgi:ATP-dependent DNA ligase
VGTGFDDETLRTLCLRLTALAVDKPAVADAPRMRRVHWVEPKLLAEISFASDNDATAHTSRVPSADGFGRHCPT